MKHVTNRLARGLIDYIEDCTDETVSNFATYWWWDGQP